MKAKRIMALGMAAAMTAGILSGCGSGGNSQVSVDENGNETRYYPMGRIFAHAVGTSEINQSGIELSQNFYMLQSNANPILNAIQDIRGDKKSGRSGNHYIKCQVAGSSL